MCVELKEVFQAGEQTIQSARVHLEVLLQLPDVHMQHDFQCSHVMHLGLHQLCAMTSSYMFMFWTGLQREPRSLQNLFFFIFFSHIHLTDVTP